jgi:hypothetical protein
MRRAGFVAPRLKGDIWRYAQLAGLLGQALEILMMYAASYAQLLREAPGYGWVDVAGRFELARWAKAKSDR